MAVSEYDKKNLSQKDQDRIADVTSKAQRGEMSWADAHKAAESIRGNAGYSGGRYGNEYNRDRGNSSSGGSSKVNLPSFPLRYSSSSTFAIRSVLTSPPEIRNPRFLPASSSSL